MNMESPFSSRDLMLKSGGFVRVSVNDGGWIRVWTPRNGVIALRFGEARALSRTLRDAADEAVRRAP